MMIAAYDWPKSTGHPVVRYELRLPHGVALPPEGDIRLGQWQGASGRGIYIDRTGTADGRAQISGSFAIDSDSKGSDMALGWAPNLKSRWRIPITGDAPLDQAFGPWQQIEFLPARARHNTVARRRVSHPLSRSPLHVMAGRAAAIDTALHRR